MNFNFFREISLTLEKQLLHWGGVPEPWIMVVKMVWIMINVVLWYRLHMQNKSRHKYVLEVSSFAWAMGCFDFMLPVMKAIVASISLNV